MAFEVMCYIKDKTKGNSTHITAKFDMIKAYDKVEWIYLKAIMVKMGFQVKWVDMITECLASA